MTGAQDAFRKVLLVEDSPAIKTLAESILRQAGYGVSTVTSGADALERVRAELPDLVLLDLSLPDLDGEKVCELLKSDSSLRSTLIVVLLNTQEIKRQKKLKSLGADGFVLKPFIPKELVNQIQELTHKQEGRRDEQAVSSDKESEAKPGSTEPHDYEWFVKEMKKEEKEESSNTPPEEKPSPAEKVWSKERKLECKGEEVSSEQDGYENFISHFKEETKLEDTHGPLVYSELEIGDNTEGDNKIEFLKDGSVRKTQDKERALNSERVAKELIQEVASRVAQEIVENLDKETLRALIRKKIEEFSV